MFGGAQGICATAAAATTKFEMAAVKAGGSDDAGGDISYDAIMRAQPGPCGRAPRWPRPVNIVVL